MRRLLAPSVLVLAIFVSVAAYSADTQKGVDDPPEGALAVEFRKVERLADQGNPVAQFLLGHMYRMGSGVSQNYESAVMWFTRAAEQGHISAQFNLGLMSANGDGTAQNLMRAHMWWNIAALRGDLEAKRNRAIFGSMMTPAQLETAEQLARDCVAQHYKDC